MSKYQLTAETNSLLPPELREAQEAVKLPEVQEMLKKLAKYNLGICMPHMHDDMRGSFQSLPADTVQVEADLQVQFLKRDETEQLQTIPVAWRWFDNGVISMATCVQECVYVSLQSGGEAHKKMHHQNK